MIVAAVDSGRFSTAQIGLTAAVTGLISLPLALWLLRPRSFRLAALVTAVAMVATFGWRLCANMPQLNKDGISGYSANDWLAPIIVFVMLSIYADLLPPADPRRFRQVRAAATIVAFAVNVITI